MSFIERSRCRISLATLFWSGGGASRVGVGVVAAVGVAAAAAAVVVVAAVGGPDFGSGLGRAGRVLVTLGGGISLIVGSSDISDRYRLYLVYAINRGKKTIDFSKISSKMSPAGYWHGAKGWSDED